MKLVDMKIDAKEREEQMEALSQPSPEPFPYGLRLSLCDDEMDKLGLKEPLKAGTQVKIEAVAVVTDTHDNESIGGRNVGMSIQITSMGLQASSGKGAAKTLYSGMKSEDD